MVSPENINTSRTLQTKQAVFIYTYMHETIIIGKKRGHEFKRYQDGFVGAFGERKGKGEMM